MFLSVIIPVFNQEENIEKNLTLLQNCLLKDFESFEIIAVNDGSSDKSLEILKRLSFIQLISYPENRGKGYAIRRGVMAAKGKYIFFTDADLSYSPSYILCAIKLLNEDKSDAVLGVRRYIKEEYPMSRKLLSHVFSSFVKWLLKLETEDSQCGFKGFKKSLARNIFADLTIFRFGFDAEILLKAKELSLKLSFLPVHFTHFPSSVRLLKDSREMLFSLFKLKHRRYRLEKYRQR